MSSKTQFKDALKRQKQINSELIQENEKLKLQLKRALFSIKEIKKTSDGLNKMWNGIRWWQFWKLF